MPDQFFLIGDDYSGVELYCRTCSDALSQAQRIQLRGKTHFWYGECPDLGVVVQAAAAHMREVHDAPASG